MATIDFTIRIERSVEDVFRVLTTPELTPLWSESAIEEHVTTPGPVGVGSRRRATVRRLGEGRGRTRSRSPTSSRTGGSPSGAWNRSCRLPLPGRWQRRMAGHESIGVGRSSSVAGCARSVPSSSESSGEASVAISGASRRSWSPATWPEAEVSRPRSRAAHARTPASRHSTAVDRNARRRRRRSRHRGC